MNTLKKTLGICILGTALAMLSCNKDDEPIVVPTVTTANVTDITETDAIGGGTIVDDGNAAITSAGLVYSSAVSVPTIADSKTTVSATTGGFTSPLENLSSGTTYYVRAYAINDVGIAFGDVVEFSTANKAPEASNINIMGTIEANMEVSADYTYTDVENDTENGTGFQWYSATDASGSGETAISGATSQTYTITDDLEGKFIAVGVTPMAASGTTTGTEVKSIYFEVGAATTVTFMYNGEEVTYGIITSATTGKKWLDRNLGATNAPSAVDDYANYGDLFQWGRLDDGHQAITRSGPDDADVTGVSGTTSAAEPFEYSSMDSPGHSKFIIVPTSSPEGGEGFDWRQPQNDALWQGVDGTNNPCPFGWRIPTLEEFQAENITTVEDGFNKLNITLSGRRALTSDFYSSTIGYYWTSTLGIDSYNDLEQSMRVYFTSSSFTESSSQRANAYACRCIKDE